MNVLIVEDDDGVGEALEQALGFHGFLTHRVCTGAEALERLTDTNLVLLDLGLPDLDGYEVCQRIRDRSCVPIIALSGRTKELDRVLVLHMGADDFIPKPFSRYELVARIGAVSRRARGCRQHGTGQFTPGGPAAQSPATPTDLAPLPPSAPPPSPSPSPSPSSSPCQTFAPLAAEHRVEPHRSTGQAPLQVGPLRLEARTRKVFVHGEEIHVTRKEFDLLAMLMEAPGAVMGRQDIMSRVWDENWFGSTRTLDVHVGSLRSKLGSSGWIETVRGVGYRLTIPAAAHT
ncbi:response regulator transcription factor [Streptomyces sp. NEAU-S7GS2]|uniref:response regulator transcription factor n=1 Tax=Streptomyces TaxID=1883 RepID=UPI000D6F9E98|nr:response regulator transcription factor [Streptomyces sp. NEAU-S7GS2]AWN28634.1 DNA-binding response regulator [Streptomyces sp. NEAU-S7GS2]